MDTLIGRDREVALLRDLATDVVSGRGRSVWIEGEPGIGKSALLAAGLADLEKQGCQVFSAQADEADALFPLRVLLDAMGVEPGSTDPTRSHLASLIWGMDRDLAKVAGHSETTASAVAAEALLVVIERCCAIGSVVLAVDDLQWADELTLAMWARLHRATTHLPLLLVGTARPVPQRPEVDRLRRTVDGRDTAILRLGPLAGSEVERLVTRQIGAVPGADLLGKARLAGGNPLYLTELVDVLLREGWVRTSDGIAHLNPAAPMDNETPRSLTAVIAARLKFLSEPTAGILRLAALLGVDFSADQLSTLSGVVGPELVNVVSEAMAAGVVVDAGPALKFRHPLIRESLYRATPKALQTALHRNAAKALADAGAPAENVAHQLLMAGPAADAWAIDWLAAVAPQLVYRAPQVAVDLLRLIGDPIGTAVVPRRRQFDNHLVTALFLLGRFDEVEPLARAALAHTVEAGSAGPMAWTLAYVLLRLTRYEEAAAVAVDALRQSQLTELWAARIRAIHALILVTSGQYAKALASAAQAEADGKAVGDRLAIGYALHAMSLAQDRHLRDPMAFLDTVDRALATIGALPETTDLRLILLGNRASMLGELGKIADADRAIGQALTLAERVGTPLRLAMLRVQIADWSYYLGRWDEASTQLTAATDFPLDTAKRLWLRGLAGLIAIHRGEDDIAGRHLADDDDPPLLAGDLWYYGFYLMAARAAAAERDNQPRRALSWLLRAFTVESTLDFEQPHSGTALWMPDVVRLAIAVGEHATARAATVASAAEAEQHPQLPASAVARHCRGLLESKPDDIRGAAQIYRDMNGYPLARAQALEDAAVLFASRHAERDARIAYTDAVEIYLDLGAQWDIRRADARLRPLGIRRGARGSRRRPASGWQALTPTEVTIAHLIANGQTNPDIAAQLYLSPRTVQSHVSHILAKLEVKSRVDIARHALSSPTRAPAEDLDKAGIPSTHPEL